MAKYYQLHADDVEQVSLIGKALSAPVRLEILKLLYYESLNVCEIAEKLNIPASSAGIHVKALEAAGLINTEIQPGSHGSMKLCSRKMDYVTIDLSGHASPVHERTVFHMPVGAFTDCDIHPTCGLCSEDTYIGQEDRISSFYLEDRIKAQILWSSGGYVEYRFANPFTESASIKCLTLSFECCSEAPNFREDWKSDISVWINNVNCGSWTCPGDFGMRRGKLNPDWWANGNTQYGILVNWSVRANGTWINGQHSSSAVIDELCLPDKPYISVRIGNSADAVFKGGFNLFGSKFGDYNQDIDLIVEY
jgi:predicted transcriptional regulator